MSKRSRRERRAHQNERAAAEGDVAALARLVEQSPRGAVAAVARALATPPEDPGRATELDALALRLCRGLRRAGESASALAVAAAAGRRSMAMRLEEALAAFASGDDGRAAEVAAADEAVAAVVGLLLGAVRGEVGGPSPSGAAPSLRALHAAARAAAHAVRGEADKARAVVGRIPADERHAVLAPEIAAAAALGDLAGAVDALTRLGVSPLVATDAGLRRLAAGEAAVRPEDLAALPAVFASDPGIVRRVVPAQLAEATSPGTIAEVVRRAGVDAFDASERGAAALYLGFTGIRAEPAAAARSFDEAIQLGGDLLESLRGKALAALALAHDPDGLPDTRAHREAGSAADRLAHALERVPRAGPLAAAAGRLAAKSWVAAGEARSALASIGRARPLAGGKLSEALDLLEVDALEIRNPAEASRRIEAILAKAPENVAAWKKKADLAAAQGDLARAQEIVVEAAEVTKDPNAIAAAREIRGERGEIAPFEGLVPGVATAGALVKELERTIGDEDDPLPRAAACRDALGPAARLAFDAAGVAITACNDVTHEVAEERLRAAFLTHRAVPGDLARLTAVAVLADLDDAILRAARALKDGDDAPAVTAIAEALAVAGKGKLVAKLLPRIAPSLSRERVAMFKTIAGGKHRAQIPGIPDPDQAARELDLALAPEFSLSDHLRERDLDDDDEDDDAGGLGLGALGLPGEGGILGDLLETLGIPAEAVETIPDDKLLDLERRLLKLAVARPTPAMMEEIVSILNESGIGPRFGSAPRPRRRR